MVYGIYRALSIQTKYYRLSNFQTAAEFNFFLAFIHTSYCKFDSFLFVLEKMLKLEWEVKKVGIHTLSAYVVQCVCHVYTSLTGEVKSLLDAIFSNCFQNSINFQTLKLRSLQPVIEIFLASSKQAPFS